MKLCGLYGSTNYKRAGSASLRNYRALFLRRNGGGTSPFAFCIFHRDLFRHSRKLDGDVVPEFCIISHDVLFMPRRHRLCKPQSLLMLVVNLENSDKTVTRWKYYFYLTQFKIQNSAYDLLNSSTCYNFRQRKKYDKKF